MLQMIDVHGGYGGATVLNGLSLGVEKGECVFLLGRNGMGKTSTLRALMRMSEPGITSGDINWGDKSCLKLTSHAMARLGIGYVPQGRRIFGSLSVEENLRVASRFGTDGNRMWDVDRIYTLFPGLGDRRALSASLLSGGEQQMLAISRALMTNPTLLLLDEPSEGLAPAVVLQVYETISLFQGEGMSVLVAEQDPTLALGLGTRVFVLERGVVVAIETPENIDADKALKRRYLGVGGPAEEG